MNSKEETILLLDDEDLIIKGLKRSLKIYGYTCIGTTSPKEAIDIMANNNISIIICDQKMPEMMGNEVLKYAKQTFPYVVRVLLTGYSDMNSTISAINDGLIFKYVTKPWKDKELFSVISEAYQYRDEKIKRDYILENFHMEKEMWKETMKELEATLGHQKNGAMNALLKTMKSKDIELYEHSKRVSDLSIKIAQVMGINENQIEELSLAGLFHDIGKLTINDHIVYKEGPLDSMSYDLIKEHVTYGYSIIKELGFLDSVANIMVGHHEKIDGSGYPLGLKGAEISVEARILAIVDIYDALASDRVYHKSIPPKEAVSYLEKDADTKYDSHVLKALRTVLGI